MNAIKLILKELDAEETPHPKRIMIDVLTLREAAAELARLRLVESAAKKAVDLYFTVPARREDVEQMRLLAAALKGE